MGNRRSNGGGAKRLWDPEVSSPFNALSREAYPESMEDIFYWAEEMWMHQGTYKSGIQRAVRYFMTEVTVEGKDLAPTTRKSYEDVLKDNYDINDEAAIIGDDYIGFGNSFTSLHIPFKRTLVCESCGASGTLASMHDQNLYEFNPATAEFKGTCFACKKTGIYNVRDIPIPGDKVRPVITRWPPQLMKIKQHPLSRRSEFILDVGGYDALVEGVKSSDLLFLEDTDMGILEAVCKGRDFKFAEGQIYHMDHPVAAVTLPTSRGWGYPAFMADFETSLMIYILDKYTEALAVDYLVPFRILTPEGAGTGIEGDPLMNLHMGDFTANVKDMLKRHRKNPTDWNFLPVPLKYQVLGGEASQLMPVELLEHYEKKLFNSMGIPQEFQSGGLTSGSAGPLIGFKMFEKVWQHFANALNNWVDWLAKKQGELMSWENVSAKFTPMSIYEDPEIRQIKLQLAASNEISRDTAYRTMNIDADLERRKVMDEEQSMLDLQQEREEAMAKRDANKQVLAQPNAAEQTLMAEEAAAAEQPAVAGAPPPGMAPQSLTGGAAGPAAGQSATLDDITMQAQQIAEQLLPMPHRGQALSDIKNSNELLYTAVKNELYKLEKQVQGDALAQVKQPQGA